MTDIVKRLRYTAAIRERHSDDKDPIKIDCTDAADEIERLRDIVQSLKDAIKDLKEYYRRK